MSGILRSVSQHSPADSTPNKRYSLSAFCTSPGTLQDVTMDNSYGIGYRSPCVSLQQYQGPTSPAGHGRSVREFEEQMATLRKENFNLKLRLYFIEESIPGYHQANGNDGQDTLMKQLIDSKVEMEMLRKEIQEKQDILKEAAQAMNQMERIQKETESKSQAMIDELKQKLQFHEMERDMEKSQNVECMSELLGHAQLAENMDTLQKIREMEGVIKQADEKIKQMENQISSVNDLLSKRDETIKEYEDKVKELVYQNAELLESLESKEKEVGNAERIIRGLRMTNADLKDDNEHLTESLKSVQQNYRNEISNMKLCERQMRDQQETLNKMQSAIATKTANTTRLLDRLQEYEKMVTKMNFERNAAKRENRFFRTIIAKLRESNDVIALSDGGDGGGGVVGGGNVCGRDSQTECYAIEKAIYQEVAGGSGYVTNLTSVLDGGEHYETASVLEMSARGDYQQREFKLKEKYCVNFCNHMRRTKFNAAPSLSSDGGDEIIASQRRPLEHHYLRHVRCGVGGGEGGGGGGGEGFDSCGCELDGNSIEPEIPIRYTISDASLFGTEEFSKSSSCTSVHANVSSASLIGVRNSPPYEMLHNEYEPLLLEREENQELRKELQDRKTELADKICLLQEAEEKLKDRIQIHEQACRTIQKLMLKIKTQQDEINRLQNVSANSAAHNSNPLGEDSSEKKKDDDWICTGLCRSFSESVALHELAGGSQQQKCEIIIRQQETTIKTLRAEIKKKTSNLQNLVNKELWEKNREIERLTKLLSATSPCNSSSQQAAASDSGNITHELQQSFTDAEYAKALERNKLLQRKLNILIQRLKVEHNNEILLSKLRAELCEARADAEKAEKWRNECADVCSILSNRLEELAGFLNSLLKHKDVLGVLAADRRRAMRKAVDRSLDLSKSLNRTLSISGTSMLNPSMAQLSDLSHLLCEVEGMENRTFNSHEELFAQQALDTACAGGSMKKDMTERKKERRSLPLTMKVDASESEWSEPDRKVSLARIGLEERSNSLAPAKDAEQQVRDTDSESDVINKGQTAKVNTSQTPKARVQERLTQLEDIISQRDGQIVKISTQLVEADNRLKRENLRVQDMSQEIEQLRQRNEELHSDLMQLGAQEHEQAHESSAVLHEQSLLQRQMVEKTRALEQLQEERDRLAVEARLAELQIAALKADMDELKRQNEFAIATAIDAEAQRMAALRRELEQSAEDRLAEQERQHKHALTRDWVARSLYDETKEQLCELQRQYTEAQRSIDNLNETEQELKQTLVDNELAARALKKQLDESTLQASKAVLERTKAFNDKMRLEQNVQELTAQLDAQRKERDMLVAQLESAHQQANAAKSSAALVSGSRTNSSDTAQSGGYTSEELQRVQDNTATNSANAIGNISGSSGVHRKNISSPDLGIESDAGRHSSVEISNAQRLLLQTVELKAKNDCIGDDMEAVFEQENIKPSNNQIATANSGAATVNAPIVHDCVKVEQENIELRRKLIRTKRAFEDTYEKLRIANQRKAQIEKDIKNQILKTHNVLKNVRSNMENEL